MPQATPELQAKFPGMDSEAWKVLEDSQNFSEHRFLIYPHDPKYKPTERESDAIDYLIQEWDWAYQQDYVNSEEWQAEHIRKMKIVHAVWLVSYMQSLRGMRPTTRLVRLGLHGLNRMKKEHKLNTTAVINEVARLLGYEPKHLFQGFNRDYLDRAWCSRPKDWKPQDSLASCQSPSTQPTPQS